MARHAYDTRKVAVKKSSAMFRASRCRRIAVDLQERDGPAKIAPVVPPIMSLVVLKQGDRLDAKKLRKELTYVVPSFSRSQSCAGASGRCSKSSEGELNPDRK